jgi:hypothetical protein
VKRARSTRAARRIALGALAGALLCAGSGDADPARRPSTYEERTGSFFESAPAAPGASAPSTKILALPDFADATAIWGSIGRDLQGKIWIGVSANSPGKSAHLIQYDPEADAMRDRGSVIDQLKAVGLHRPGEGQVKIHSRIVTAEDGWLYFASTDEEGEDEKGTALPRWGGHLWRVDPDSGTWQHLGTVPEGLVAASGVGRYIYALGYWNHVLYQYDTATGKTARTVVGSVGGHVSRNLLSDGNGHAYVPRLAKSPEGKITAALVEYDAALREVAATPLEYYVGKGNFNLNHGLIALAYLADGRMVFTTHRGHLYMIEPQADGAAKVTAVGWFHPAPDTYSPSLFSLDGRRYLAGVARRGRRFEWVTFDLQTRKSTAHALDTKGLKEVLLYCSVSRDNAGRFYVGGWASDITRNRSRPLLLQIGVAP